MGLNLTGTPNTDSYNIGRGKVYIAELVNGLPGPSGWRDLGNAPEFNINVEVETLEHQSSQRGLKITDKEVTISQEVNCSFQLDEIDFNNLALFFSGQANQTAFTNPAIAGVAATVITTAVNKGSWYDLTDAANGAGTRLVDIDPTLLTVRRDPSGTPVTLVEGTDYTVDAKYGRLFFLTTSVTVLQGDEIDFAITADAGAVNPSNVQALTQSSVRVALKFISENPANNDKQTEYQFHQIQLKAEGDLALIGDEFTTMGFTGTAEVNSTLGGSASPTLTITDHANA